MLVVERDARVARRVRPGDDPWARLDAWIDGHLALGEDASAASVACWVAMGVEAVTDAEVGSRYTAAMTESVRAVEALLVEAGVADPLEGARGLVAAIEGAYRLAAGAPGAVEPGFAAPAVRRLARGLR